MIKAYCAPALSAALTQLKKMIALSEAKGRRTVIFCEDRLTLAAERTVCSAVGGTFLTSVYTFARFLSSERGKAENILSGQGSAMAIRRIIDKERANLKLFGRLNTVTAAQGVYDTLALLYSSRVSADDLAEIKSSSPLLASKLADLSLLYKKYSEYLSESGYIDRNAYLKGLPEVISESKKIKGADVIFLGFQALTCSVAECVRACMDTADNVYGLFLSGAEEIYTNEAITQFVGCANAYGGCEKENLPSGLCEEAETLRKCLFDPESFHSATPVNTGKIHLYEAGDEEEELEFIAASIIKHVYDGVRYQSISVMPSSAASYTGALERVFARYKIPYYIDCKYPLSEHPVCAFVCDYLNCVADGCTPESVIAVISSPVFGAKKKDRDIFENYVLRLASFRGGVKREPDRGILEKFSFDYDGVCRVRDAFLAGLKLLPQKADGADFSEAIVKLLELFKVAETLGAEAEEIKDDYPSLAAFAEKAAERTVLVVQEAGRISHGDILTAKEFSRVLKSGFAAAEISLIPPKQDAVFVGDITSCANVGTEVLFAAGLTGDVPSFSQDTAILTDKELTSLEELNVAISPKIMQVNMRSRELTALNLCAFRRALYLTYPIRKGGEESTVSEIVVYAKNAFRTAAGMPLTALNGRRLSESGKALPYFASRPEPAMEQMMKSSLPPSHAAAIYKVLEERGFGDKAKNAVNSDYDDGQVPSAKRLYGNSISPTALENYFSCPYKCFVKNGLRAQEREEGAIRPLDSGNFVHAVLQKLAEHVDAVKDETELKTLVSDISDGLLKQKEFASFSSDKRGEYAREKLIEEAEIVSLGAYEQLKNSGFKVSECEKRCELYLDSVKISGRIDRVDSCGDMVRVIDYKTGKVDGKVPSYYAGLKLQLPLYLTAAADGKRAVGAYYFPATYDYADERDGVFRLQGFMDGSDEVVKSSDKNIVEGKKSDYIEASLGKYSAVAMSQADFAHFLSYAKLVASKGASEMTGGNVAPSPAEDACKFCSLKGSCRFRVGVDGEVRVAPKAKGTDIIRIAAENAEVDE